jgi:hypothetical protein
MQSVIHTQLFDLPPELIPPRLQEISSYFGHQTAMVLLLHYSGVHLHIPKKPNPLHKLAELLGMAEFSKLCTMFGDNSLQIPRAANAIRALRNQAILKDFASGILQSDIARHYGITERQVNKICNTVAIDRKLYILNDFDGGLASSDIATKHVL